MKVFMTGATGVIGNRVVRRLVETGDQVTGVARTDQKAAFLRQLGAEPVQVSLFDDAALKDAINGHNAVANLVTNIPPLDQALNPQAWETNDRLRNEASVKLAKAAAETGCGVFIQESITIPYAASGENWIDESVEVIRPPELASNGIAEEQAKWFAETGGQGIVLRFAMFYSHDGSYAQAFQAAIRAGQSPFMGDPDGYISMVHAEDAATAVVSALDAPADIYNVADDEPMRRRDLANTIAKIEGVAPPALPETMGGEVPGLIEALMRSQRISNKRFKEMTGWAPQYRSVQQGWSQLTTANRRNDDGTGRVGRRPD